MLLVFCADNEGQPGERRIASSVLIAAVIALALAPSPAHAQVPTPAAPTQPAAPPPVFSGKATIALSFQSGQTDLNGIEIGFQGRRTLSAGGALKMSLNYEYGSTAPPGQSERVTVANRLAATSNEAATQPTPVSGRA